MSFNTGLGATISEVVCIDFSKGLYVLKVLDDKNKTLASTKFTKQ